MPLKRRQAPSKKQPSGGRVALIDGDIIRYQAASVSDKVSYTCIDGYSCKYKKDMVDYCHVNNLPIESITKSISPEPLSYCLHTVKQMIHGIMDKCNAGTARVFLTGKGNYREDIDSRYPYKGNRPDGKPTHFIPVGDYLESHFDAEVVDGIEADDAMSMAQWEDYLVCDQDNPGTVICTRDKDLLGTPGLHFDWVKDEEPYWVTEYDADEFFYKQLLMGDKAVDNIVGIHGIGIVKATSILLDCKDNVERYNTCLLKYEEAGMDYYDLLENANLLYMMREPNQHWSPPL